MAKIIDPDNLVRSTTKVNCWTNWNIWIDTPTKKIMLRSFWSLTTDWVTLQAVYSFIKEEWKDDSILIKFPFPFISITNESFELINWWDFEDTTSKNLLRDGWWALKDWAWLSQEEYANITTLGSFNNAGTDLAYVLQSAVWTPTDIVLTWPVNQAVKIYWDATHWNFDYRWFFKIFLREQAKTYDSYDLLTAQNIASLTYKKYAMPLSNATDLKVTENDITVDAYWVTITWYWVPQVRSIGWSNYNFNIIINGNNKTAEQIYMSVQSKLRKATDIDNWAWSERWDISDAMLQFVWDTLKTKYTTDGWVYIDNFQTADTNRLVFVDNTWSERTFPFVASGSLNFNDNLVNDTDWKYWMFFTSVWTNNFWDTDAIIVNNSTWTPITWSINSNSVSFDFDYDGNVQWWRTAWTNADVTIVAIWLDKWQYVVATWTITRSNANNFTLTSALERNYSNPI